MIRTLLLILAIWTALSCALLGAWIGLRAWAMRGSR